MSASRRSSIWLLGLWATLGALTCAPPEPSFPLPQRDEALSLDLSEGESRIYRTELSRGEVLRLKVDQDGVDIALRISGPGREQQRFDSGNAFDGPEWLIVRAERSGRYRVEIEAIGARPTAGPKNAYLTVENRGKSSSGDDDLLDAFRVLESTGEEEATEEAVTELERLRQDPESSLPGLIRARVAYRLGTIHRYAGRPVEAASYLTAADEEFGRFGNAWEQTPALNHLAFVLIQLGRLDDAENALERAEALSAQTEQPRTRASTWSLWGILHATRGAHSHALRAHRRAEEIFGEARDPKGLADCRQNIGTQLLLLGAVDEGLEVLREAADLWRDLDRPLDLGRALLTLSWGLELRAELTDESDDLDEALDLSHQAVDRFSALGAPWELAVGLEHRGALLSRLEEPERALEDLERSAELIDAETDRMHPHWVGLAMGPVLHRLGDFEKAVLHLEDALAGFEALGHYGGQVACHLELARLDRSVGHRQEAADRLNRAIEILEEPRESLRTEEFRRSYLALHQDVYEELVDLWAEAAWNEGAPSARARRMAEKAVEAAERGKARGLRDRLAASRRRWDDAETGAELRRALDALEARSVLPASVEDGIRPPGRGVDDPGGVDAGAVAKVRMEWQQLREADSSVDPSISRAEPFSASSIDSLIDEDTALLVYALGSRRSWAFQVTAETIRVQPLRPRREIEEAARRAHVLLPRWDTPGSRIAARKSLEDLAASILDPLGSLPAAERLVVVPAGSLHLVPFSVLPLDRGRPLVANRRIVYLPSIAALERMRQRSRERPDSGPEQMAVVFDPIFGPDDSRLPHEVRVEARRGERYLPRLFATQDEAGHIEELVAGLEAGPELSFYQGFEADADLLRHGALAQARFLHIATHGLIDSRDPSIAGLVFALFDAEGHPRNGFLPMRDLDRIQVDADLVVLSACRTGTGREVRGEGIVGLSHGFFAAGARHLIVSLWDVEDRATAELMKRFYSHLFSGQIEPDQALRAAQNEMREHPEWSSPRHWAGFVSLGDWRLEAASTSSVASM